MIPCILPRSYLTTPPQRTMVSRMPPKTIVMENTPESLRAWRIAAMLYSASVLEGGGFREGAEYLKAMGAALKYGVPDGSQSFADDDDDHVEVEVTE